MTEAKQAKTDYEDVSIYPLDEAKIERLCQLQSECAVLWTTSDHWPVGVMHRFVYADGKFFVNGWNGRLSMVGGQAGALEVAGEVKVGMGSGQHFAHPVLADGRIYLRRGDALEAPIDSEGAALLGDLIGTDPGGIDMALLLLVSGSDPRTVPESGRSW